MNKMKYEIDGYGICSSCGGSGLALNDIGEPAICRKCKGDGVVPLMEERLKKERE